MVFMKFSQNLKFKRLLNLIVPIDFQNILHTIKTLYK